MTAQDHPVMPYVQQWCEDLEHRGYMVDLYVDPECVDNGDILFLISYPRIVSIELRSRFEACLVLHASDLPMGRGWSPHVWNIINGGSQIVVSLIEADDPVDTGCIWLKTVFELKGDELFDEINHKLFQAELSLMNRAVDEFDKIKPKPQCSASGSYFRRRTPEDSRLDPKKTIAEQFNIIRVSDPNRFPAFIDYRGFRYVIKVEKQRI